VVEPVLEVELVEELEPVLKPELLDELEPPS
jgi:hypothetical protein